MRKMFKTSLPEGMMSEDDEPTLVEEVEGIPEIELFKAIDD